MGWGCKYLFLDWFCLRFYWYIDDVGYVVGLVFNLFVILVVGLCVDCGMSNRIE